MSVLPSHRLRTRPLRSGYGYASRAFTLIEMLAVIAIIVVMASTMGLVFSGGSGETQGLGSGQRMLASAVQTARNIAMMKGQRSRVIIYANKADTDRFLRFVGVIRYDDNDTPSDPSDDGWVAANSGNFLPQGSFYMPEASHAATAEVQDDSGATLVYSEAAAGTMDVNFPFKSPQTGNDSGTDWIYYEFSEDGVAEVGSSNKKLVVYTGATLPPGSSKVISVTNAFAVSGFFMTKLGGAVMTQDYDDFTP